MNNPKYKRWLAIGLLVMVISSVILTIWLLFLSRGFDYYEEKNSLLFRLQRQKNIAARKESVTENLNSIKKQFQEQAYFSLGDTEALAAADLQNIVKSVVNDAGGQLTSTQVLPGKAETGFNRIAIRVRMTGSIETMQNVLRNLEANIPLLIVDQLDITTVRVGRQQRNAKPDNSISQLNVSFQVVSFMRGQIN